MADRVPRINQLYKKEIGRILLKDVEMPDGALVTITDVDTSSNLIESKVYISCYPPEKKEEVSQVLKRNIYDIQKTINKRMKIRPVPKIIFKMESSAGEADKIEGLLEKLKNDKN